MLRAGDRATPCASTESLPAAGGPLGRTHEQRREPAPLERGEHRDRYPRASRGRRASRGAPRSGARAERKRPESGPRGRSRHTGNGRHHRGRQRRIGVAPAPIGPKTRAPPSIDSAGRGAGGVGSGRGPHRCGTGAEPPRFPVRSPGIRSVRFVPGVYKQEGESNGHELSDDEVKAKNERFPLGPSGHGCGRSWRVAVYTVDGNRRAIPGTTGGTRARRCGHQPAVDFGVSRGDSPRSPIGRARLTDREPDGLGRSLYPSSRPRNPVPRHERGRGGRRQPQLERPPAGYPSSSPRDPVHCHERGRGGRRHP